MWNLFDDVLEIFRPPARDDKDKSEDRDKGKGNAKMDDKAENISKNKGKGKAKVEDGDSIDDKAENKHLEKGKGKAKAEDPEDMKDKMFATPNKARLPSWMSTGTNSEEDNILIIFRPSPPENNNSIAGPSRAAEPPQALKPPRDFSPPRTFTPPRAFLTPRRTSEAAETARPGPSTPSRGRQENLAALESRLARDSSNNSLDETFGFSRRSPSSRRASGLRSALAAAVAGGSPSRAGRRVRSAFGQAGRAASASASSLLSGAAGALGAGRSRAGSNAGEEGREPHEEERMAAEAPAKAAKLLGLQEKKEK
jgi:hypothetical protein